jgi:hypothetical protein
MREVNNNTNTITHAQVYLWTPDKPHTDHLPLVMESEKIKPDSEPPQYCARRRKMLTGRNLSFRRKNEMTVCCRSRENTPRVGFQTVDQAQSEARGRVNNKVKPGLFRSI